MAGLRVGSRRPGIRRLGAGLIVVVVTDGAPGALVLAGVVGFGWSGSGRPGMVTPGGRHTPRATHCWVGLVGVVEEALGVSDGADGSPGLRLSDTDRSAERPGFLLLDGVGRLGSGIGLVGMTPVE